MITLMLPCLVFGIVQSGFLVLLEGGDGALSALYLQHLGTVSGTESRLCKYFFNEYMLEIVDLVPRRHGFTSCHALLAV